MAGAAALLVDEEQQGVAVAVVVAWRTNWTSPDVSPLRHTSCRLRLQNTVRPSASVSRSVSAVIHAIISTSRVVASCTMAGTRPSALYVTCASCSSVATIGWAEDVSVGGGVVVGGVVVGGVVAGTPPSYGDSGAGQASIRAPLRRRSAYRYRPVEASPRRLAATAWTSRSRRMM